MLPPAATLYVDKKIRLSLLERQTLDGVIICGRRPQCIDCHAEAGGLIAIFLFKGLDLFGRHWPPHWSELRTTLQERRRRRSPALAFNFYVYAGIKVLKSIGPSLHFDV